MIDQREAISEKAVLIGVITQLQNETQSKEYLDELEFLTDTAGGVVVKRFVQKLEKPHPKTFLGTGKLEEVRAYIDSHGVGTAIFDDELSPAQLRNIEKILDCKILDRTNLILDIFAQRAQTSSAKTQVELAQHQYLLPRLTKLWTHLDKQKGGIGMRGPGETEIETDRRIIRDKIAVLKKKLTVIDKQMAVQRKNRGKMVRVALVGYTNVGKSTLMNVISKSDVFAENKLFATLDTTVRKVVIKNIPFLMTDTVGFIRKLPTQLVESFKSTLDEVREADLLLHVVDISHPNFEDHISSVNTILDEIHCADKPTVMVFNKIDAYTYDTIDEDDLVTEKTSAYYSLEDWQKTWMGGDKNTSIFISALNKENLDAFKETTYEEVKEIHIQRFPYNDFLYYEYKEE
ncbi:GTPase HflX [Flavobacteriaceae bacterium]|jgi:GTP-binding protein HflX|nr:GTPase HflX [Flavobacterium sp.]MDA9253974.1 GTPase HflX [Flavobacteriaceae bacterium]MDA9327811.1 GTPase HflX [Flavobacteriaceae bacterium]MDB4025466.1 GTPase HflX [Flavobacteriaceae bacterium]MDB4236760.1 GTPase HflX [Flavobacteriaceae bacterium]